MCTDATQDTVDELASMIEVLSKVNRIDIYYPFLDDVYDWILYWWSNRGRIMREEEEARRLAEEEAEEEARRKDEEARNDGRPEEETEEEEDVFDPFGACIPSPVEGGECWTIE